MSSLLQFISLNPDFLKIGLVLLGVSTILMGFVSGLKKLFTKNKKKFLLYVLVTVLLFAATAFLSNKKVLNDIPLNSYIGFQVLFLCLGLLHVFTLRRIFPDISENLSDFWVEFLYTIVIAAVGLIGFLFVVTMFKPAYQYIFISSVIWFLIPFMVVKLYEFIISIPVPIYKKWFYPIDKRIQDPKNEELVNPLVISFEFSKKKNKKGISNFRLKGPEKMEFGKLFYFFINDYNERHPEGEIEFLDEKNNPYGWIFYTKPGWLGSQTHIDFTRTVEGNGIQENDVIICKRA